MRRRHLSAHLFLMLLVAVPASAADRPEYGQLLAEAAPAVVTVKAVLQVKSGGGGSSDRAVEVEVPGVVLDATGLVVCSNTMLGGISGRFGAPASLSVVPTEIKVIFGSENEGVEAKLLARDSELDLAWVQVKALGDRKIAAVDLTHAVIPVAGDEILSVQRMPKNMARAVVIMDGRVAGITAKPRTLYLATGERAPGMPVFSAYGKLIGISAVLIEDEERSHAPRNVATRFGTVVLPAAEVLKATARAKEPADTGDGH